MFSRTSNDSSHRFSQPSFSGPTLMLPLVLALAACDRTTPLDTVPIVTEQPFIEQLVTEQTVVEKPDIEQPVNEQPVNDAPLANDLSGLATLITRVSEDMSLETNAEAQLSAEVQLDELFTELATTHWEQVSGIGVALFSSPDRLQTNVTFDQEGVYVLRMTAQYANQSSADTLVVTVMQADLNKAPTINAGKNLTIKLDDVHTLTGTASDDGLPNAILSTEWSQTNGNGTATFGEVAQLETSVTFSEAGTYLLQLEVTDGELQSTDRIQIKVEAGNVVADAIVDPIVDPGTEPANSNSDWQLVNSSDGSKPQARHEAGGLELNNKFYLLGGRGSRKVNRFDPQTSKWEDLGTPGMQMNHFQPVAWNGKIYVIGALNCCYPSESVIDRIQIFDPATRNWSQGASMPNNRKRGSAGVVVYKNKIYIVGGSTNGHDGGEVNWFDEYNPATNSWKTLPNAPTKRDHFQAAVVANRLVAAGGRQTNHPDTFGNLVTTVDVFNFDSNKWETNAPGFPLPRAGTVAVSYGPEVIVIGGETAVAGAASKRVDAYNVNTRRWRRLDDLVDARHGGGAAILGNTLHVASGSNNRGGGPETQSHEELDLK